MRFALALAVVIGLGGCAPARGGGGGGHAASFQEDVAACYRQAGRAEAALAGGDRQGAVRLLDALLARLDAARAHGWLGERREWLRVEERVVLLEQAIATARPDARSQAHLLVGALAALSHGHSLAGRPKPRQVTLSGRPGLGDAGAIARRARDLLADGDAAGALAEIAALRRRVREARTYAAVTQHAELDALGARARRLEDLAASLDPRARVQAGLLAAELGDERPSSETPVALR
jgi:hypothetical protein